MTLGVGKYIRTPEIRKKISEAHKGKPSPNKGKKFYYTLTPEQHKKRSENRKGKLNPNWGKVGAMTGRKHTLESRQKMSIGIKKSFTPERLKKHGELRKGSKNPVWKGDKVSYKGLHRYLSQQFGKADLCENLNCLRLSGKFQWAKKREAKYTRNREDYFKLCTKCHYHYDHNLDFKIILC